MSSMGRRSTCASTTKDLEPNPIDTVAVRKWQGRDYGPSGKTVFLCS